MSELIKREDAIKITWQEPQYYDPINALTEVREKIRALPTVDAVPVTVCASCKYDGKCMFQSFVIDNSRDEVPYDKNTFYCADGERRTE